MRENIVMTSINYVTGTRTQKVVGKTWQRRNALRCILLEPHATVFTLLHLMLTRQGIRLEEGRKLKWPVEWTYGQVWEAERKKVRLL